jgi:hypothetical protein
MKAEDAKAQRNAICVLCNSIKLRFATAARSATLALMRFVDLFAGLGGLHLALEPLGHSCVFGSELDSDLQDSFVANLESIPPLSAKSLAHVGALFRSLSVVRKNC